MTVANLNWLPVETDKLSDAAELYAVHRWSIFPLHGIRNGRCTCGVMACANAGKHPRTLRGFRDATSDIEQVTAWWQRWPDSNIGWAMPIGTVVLDEDPRHGGAVERERLELAHGALPLLSLRAITGADGFHWILDATPAGAMTQVKIANGLDTRVGGLGYIVVAPSLHRSGKRYRWYASVSPAPCPAWLLARVTKPVAAVRPAYVPPANPLPCHMSRRQRYAHGVLRGVCKTVAELAAGSRNDGLNKAWFRVAQFADVLPESEARVALTSAGLSCGLSEIEIAKVLR